MNTKATGQRQPTTIDRLLLTTEQAAAVLGVGRTTVYALIKDGELRPIHIGRSCRLSRAELERYVSRLDAPPPEVPPRPRTPRQTSTNQSGLFDLSPTARRRVMSTTRLPVSGSSATLDLRPASTEE